MNKKYKLLAASLAVTGTIATVATAFALYQKNAEGIEITIDNIKGHTSSTDTINYTLGAATLKAAKTGEGYDVATTVETISPEYSQYWIEIPVGFEYVKGSGENAPEQDSVAGNLKASLKLEDGLAALSPKTSFYVKGYTDGTYFAHHCNLANDKSFSAEEKTISGNLDIATAKTGQTLFMWLDFGTSLTDDAFMPIAGKAAYSGTVDWGLAAGTLNPAAYVVGTGNAWKAEDDFMMVPSLTNTDTEHVTWEYKGLTGFTQLKCLRDDAWFGGAGGNNVVVAKDTTYTITYTDGIANSVSAA